MSEIDLSPMSGKTVVQVSSPSELVEAVPYLLGAEPTDSLVLLGVQPDAGGRVAPALRLDLPPPEHFVESAHRFVALLVKNGARALSLLVHVDTPPPGGHAGVDHYRPLYEAVSAACRIRALKLFEAICVQHGRWWSYLCHDPACCPTDGTALPHERRSPIAAAAVTAGLPPPTTLAQLADRIRPPQFLARKQVLQSLHRVRAQLDARSGDYAGIGGVRNETVALLQAARARFRRGTREISTDEAARLVLGLRDVQARDQAMSWEDDDPDILLHLWIALARRSLAPDSAAPLTLAAWAAWTADDPAFARVAINRALRADPHYAMAQLLHAAINGPLNAAEARRRLFPPRTPSLRKES